MRNLRGPREGRPLRFATQISYSGVQARNNNTRSDATRRSLHCRPKVACRRKSQGLVGKHRMPWSLIRANVKRWEVCEERSGARAGVGRLLGGWGGWAWRRGMGGDGEGGGGGGKGMGGEGRPRASVGQEEAAVVHGERRGPSRGRRRPG